MQSVIYAHPSLRYLKVIRDGAAHSNLDPAFQQHLASLQGYRCGLGLSAATAEVHYLTACVSEDLSEPQIMRRSCTLGQTIAGYIVLFFVLSMCAALVSLLHGYRLVCRRKLNGRYIHQISGKVISITWWMHNYVLSWSLGRGC